MQISPILKKYLVVSIMCTGCFVAPLRAQEASPSLTLQQILKEHHCSAGLLKRIADWKIPPTLKVNANAHGELSAVFTIPNAGNRKAAQFTFELKANQPLQMVKREGSELVRVNFTPESCVEELALTRINPGQGLAEPEAQVVDSSLQAQDFSNSDLAKIIDKNKTGIIYVWSPHMPFSVDGIVRIKKVAENLQIPLEFLVDPNAHPHSLSVAYAKQANNLQLPLLSMKAQDLMQLGGLNHYPVLFIYKDGKLVPKMIPGLETESDYQAKVSELLKSN